MNSTDTKDESDLANVLTAGHAGGVASTNQADVVDVFSRLREVYADTSADEVLAGCKFVKIS